MDIFYVTHDISMSVCGYGTDVNTIYLVYNCMIDSLEFQQFTLFAGLEFDELQTEDQS